MGNLVWRTRGSVEIDILAPAEMVYAAIADITKTGERSPECRSADWLPGAPPGAVGARFRGRNRSGLARWSRVCEVLRAEAGTAFVFRTVPERFDPSRRDSTTWSYVLQGDGHRTRVVHAYEITTLPMPPFRALYGRILPHHRDMRPQMAATLAVLKRTLERAAQGATAPDGRGYGPERESRPQST